MDEICTCPPAVTLPSVTPQECAEAYGLIGKFAFGILGETFADDIIYDTESSWTTRIASVTADKITMTPIFNDPQLPPSEPITFGGDDNTTFTGAPIITGETSVSMAVMFYDLPTLTYEELKQFTCEAKAGRLGVIFIGDQFSISQTDGTTVHDFIPVTSAFMGTVGSGGRVEPNKNAMTITLGAGWQVGTSVFKHINFNPINLDNV